MRAAGLPVIREGGGEGEGLVTVEFVGGYSVALSRPFSRSERARARARDRDTRENFLSGIANLGIYVSDERSEPCRRWCASCYASP
jgi:hypothetical protein